MPSKFKTNLKAEREEQNGSVFYQVSDPETGKSFRLYEVEYLIAKMLDGETPNEVMPGRVQNELQFELSLEDFGKFLRELTDLGFLESTTQREPSPPGSAPGATPSESEEIIDSDIEEIMGEPMESEGPPLEHELERLVRSGVLHIKQGMVGQARDYFLAARKCAPDDGRVATMLNHLDVVGEDDSTADLEYLWKQALQLYPELCQELGPPGSGTAPIPIEEHGRREGILTRARKRRGTLVAFVLFGAALGLGLRYAWPMLAAPPPLVETDRVRAQKIQLTFEAEAVHFQPVREWQLSFDKAGTVAEVNAKVGDDAKKGQILARLLLAPRDEKALKALRDKSTKIEKQYLATTLELERLLAEQSDRQAQVQSKKDQLDELQKSFILKTATPAAKAQAKKDLVLAKKQFALMSRDLAKLRARSARPQKMKTVLEAARAAANEANDKFLQAQEGMVLRAPEDAKIAVVDIPVGSKVKDKALAVGLADETALKITWKTSDARLMQLSKGTGVRMLTPDGSPVDGQLLTVGKDPVTQVPDPTHKLASADRKVLRLIRETLDNALVVSAAAKLGQDGSLVVEGEQVFHRKVEWIEVRGKDAIARSGVRVGEELVTGPQEMLLHLKDHDKVRLDEGAQ